MFFKDFSWNYIKPVYFYEKFALWELISSTIQFFYLYIKAQYLVPEVFFL